LTDHPSRSPRYEAKLFIDLESAGERQPRAKIAAEKWKQGERECQSKQRKENRDLEVRFDPR
jgi:hypothetical protein